MLFLNPWLLAGLAGVSIPIIIHLVRQQAAKPIEWGAMRFLFDTIAVRKRRMEWEDLLLMAARCLLLGLLALALARPFLTPDSKVPWLFVLPAALAGIALLGGSFVLTSRKPRWIVRGIAIAILLLAACLGFMEKILNLRRFEASGRRDVALIIDASSSMQLQTNGRSVFSQAVEEAKQLVKEAPRGTAFTVVLGGPAPQAVTAAPLTHRADVLGVLDSLQPIGGTFRAHEALGMATVALSEGTNASKEIIVFTDSQRAGWRLENPGSWDNLGNAWKGMPAKPKLLVRNFGAPATFRNVSLASLESSRTVVGTDREVTFRVTVENTGNEAVTPGPVVIEIDGGRSTENPVGLLTPGQKETVEFRHRFAKSGPTVVTARINASDDLVADDRIDQVIPVRSTLPVLLVDGNPAGSFFERAAGYSALALAPSTALIGGKKAEGRFLMDPRVISAAALGEEDLADAAVVILADVPRIPERLANKLADRVAAGTGLIIIAGPRAESSFYNQWQGIAGPLCPLPIGEEAGDDTGISPASSTFVHEALGLFTKNTDLETAQVKRWRKTGERPAGTVLAAAFANGEPFLASRNYGNGRTFLATCALDARSGNLPARKSFVPLVHELVTWTAGGGVSLNVDSSWSPSVALTQASGGLSAQYFNHREQNKPPVHQTIDPAIDFQWGEGRPHKKIGNDNFSIRWQGSIVAPADGEYLFEADVDDRVNVKVGGQSWKTEYGLKELGRIQMEAGKPLPIDIRYEEDGGQARMRLFWTPPGGSRHLIPSAAFLPLDQSATEELKATDPLGMPRNAAIRSGRRGQELAIDGPAIPGIYEVSSNETIASIFPTTENGMLPVSVRRDPNESQFDPMNGDDRELIRKHVDFLEPRSVPDMIAVLQGKGFGREIWKVLALAAFILFLLESLLARWVSKSRRAAEDVRIDFGGDTVWRGAAR
jgi:hypothetical protein